jgi:hypothetical protein
MTIKETVDRTPNGLHDAYLLGVSIDYGLRKASFRINWDFGMVEPVATTVFREGTLSVSGLQYLVIEPPWRDSRYETATYGYGEPSYIDGYVTRDDDVQRLNLPLIPVTASRYSLFVGAWNSFIHFAAESAAIEPPELLIYPARHVGDAI